ncbi:hypothetical protein PR048_031596 [Dryococelus australis]|uniref:Alkaline phosphatase n=1 Tax=Dryococelus australis TaxID=614101 RepID=A0ABQ9G8D8_9NEOP|nr:hypothetical protein PR048_031596 [Dryococelus australis]
MPSSAARSAGVGWRLRAMFHMLSADTRLYRLDMLGPVSARHPEHDIKYGPKMERRWSAMAGETGVPRENTPANGIVQHDSHMRKSGSEPAGYRARIALVGGERPSHCATAAPHKLSRAGMQGKKETRDARENPLTSFIVRHCSHGRKSGSDPARSRVRLTAWFTSVVLCLQTYCVVYKCGSLPADLLRGLQVLFSACKLTAWFTIVVLCLQTYCVDSQVADSACTATAFLSGVKTNRGIVGVSAKAEARDCETLGNTSNHITSIVQWAQGNKYGLVRSSVRPRCENEVELASCMCESLVRARGDWRQFWARARIFGQYASPLRSVSMLASHQGEPGSIPDRVTGFSQVGFVPDDEVGRRVFSGISCFPHPFIPVLLHTHLNCPHRLSGPRCKEPPESLHSKYTFRYRLFTVKRALLNILLKIYLYTRSYLLNIHFSDDFAISLYRRMNKVTSPVHGNANLTRGGIEYACVCVCARWQEAGRSTGLVTTTRVTHATPSGAYAHADRSWENDADTPRPCKDIAAQLILDQPGKDLNVRIALPEGFILYSILIILFFFYPLKLSKSTFVGLPGLRFCRTAVKVILHFIGCYSDFVVSGMSCRVRRAIVIMGGGRKNFRKKGARDEEGERGARRDPTDLIAEWKEDKSLRNATSRYVWNRSDLLSVDTNDTEYLLGSLPDIRMWESYRMMPLVGGFSRGTSRPSISVLLHTSLHPHRLSRPRLHREIRHRLQFHHCRHSHHQCSLHDRLHLLFHPEYQDYFCHQHLEPTTVYFEVLFRYTVKKNCEYEGLPLTSTDMEPRLLSSLPDGRLKNYDIGPMQFIRDTLKELIGLCKGSSTESQQVISTTPHAALVGIESSGDNDKAVNAKDGINVVQSICVKFTLTRLSREVDELQNKQSSDLNADDDHATPTKKLKLDIEDEPGIEDDHEDCTDDDYDDSDEPEDDGEFLDALTHLSTTFTTGYVKKAEHAENIGYLFPEYPNELVNRLRHWVAFQDGNFLHPASILPRRSVFNPRPGNSGFSHVGIVPDDAVGRLVFWGISRFPRPFIPALLHTHLDHPHRHSMLRAVQISSLHQSISCVHCLQNEFSITYAREFRLNIFTGLFASDHMAFNLEADKEKQPTLAEMTRVAIKILQNNVKGYFLLVEGGLIDHAHHSTRPHKALDETAQLHEAVQAAVDIADEQDTLIVVTADHSHTMSYSGYARRGGDILGDRLAAPTLVIQAVHDRGPRLRGGCFASNELSCGTFLVQSELFPRLKPGDTRHRKATGARPPGTRPGPFYPCTVPGPSPCPVCAAQCLYHVSSNLDVELTPMRVVEVNVELGLGKREIPRVRPRRPTASLRSGTIPTCDDPVTRPGIEPGPPWWEASRLIAQPPWPPRLAGVSKVDNLPYSTLSYANGPGYRKPERNRKRPDLKNENMSKFIFTPLSGVTRDNSVPAYLNTAARPQRMRGEGEVVVEHGESTLMRWNTENESIRDGEYRFPATVPLKKETHGGDDVAVFARGPWAHLFAGVYEQNVVAHLMAFASCVGSGFTACNWP